MFHSYVSKATKEKNRLRRQKYNVEFRIERRKILIKHLGGKCNNCGCDDHEVLEFDHIDPKTKTIAISRNMFLALDTLLEELKKCQLLCVQCHTKKTMDNKEYG